MPIKLNSIKILKKAHLQEARVKRYDYDVVVIGGGAAGLTAAKLARGLGKTVALVEKDKLGGECTWTGCVPSKALIHAAHVARSITTSKRVGIISQSVPFSFETSGVMPHVRAVVKEVYKTHTPEVLERTGITVLFDSPSFVDTHTLALSTGHITAHKIIIATGSEPFVPPLQGIDTIAYLTNQTLFDSDELPRSLLILGGGPIGCEMASAFNLLGTTVTLVETNDRVLANEEADMALMLMDHMKQSGIAVRTGLQAIKVHKEADVVYLTCKDASGSLTVLQAHKLLVAVGRRPRIGGLNLGKAGIKTTPKGIVVDSYLRTSIPTIYACGDVVGPYLFSHMAYYQAAIAARNACIPVIKKKVNYDHVCWVTFTEPEFARAGMTSDQARQHCGDTIQVVDTNYTQIDRSYTDDTMFGKVKIVLNKKGKILGAHVLGARAGELIGQIQLGKSYHHKLTDFYHVIYPYPTYGELLWQTAKYTYIKNLKAHRLLRFLTKLLRGYNRESNQ